MRLVWGVRVSTLGKTRVRAVTHLDVTRDQVVKTLDVFSSIAAGMQL